MAERGRIYRWPRNRSLGDAKARPVIVIAPDAATEVMERWVVVPISSDPRLEAHPLAVPLSPWAVSYTHLTLPTKRIV